MSTPRFKKDKEIIAEYESQVKGKGERAFGSDNVLFGIRWTTSRGYANVDPSPPESGFKKLVESGLLFVFPATHKRTSN